MDGWELLRGAGVPVVLAPMAGITNRAFRRLAREESRTVGAPELPLGQPGAPSSGGKRRAYGLYVCEMITARALVERDADTMRMVEFDPDEVPRSVQLYGVDPEVMYAAVSMLVDEDRADHIDMNFGCPVPKVTRKGGGSALPWKRDLFRDIVGAAVSASEAAARRRRIDAPPVTVKMRMGIDDEHLTYLDAGRIAAQQGVAWVALHGRTAAQMYADTADWSAIARLKEELTPYGIPVLGNGDIWSAADAARMVERTGVDGVVVGRGCLGRPWLFAQLTAYFLGQPIPPEPDLAGVQAAMRRHAQLLVEVLGEDKGPRDFRKHVAWYLKGFRVGSRIRSALALIDDLAELDDLLAEIEPDQAYAVDVATAPRGRSTGHRRPSLPDGWLDSPYLQRDDEVELQDAELAVSGG